MVNCPLIRPYLLGGGGSFGGGTLDSHDCSRFKTTKKNVLGYLKGSTTVDG